MSDIKSTFINLTNNLAKSSGDFVKNTKLNMELANQEETLKGIYIEIGKKVHEIYAFGGSLGNAFDDLYRDLVLCEGKIKDLQERIDIVKGVRTCETCGKGVDRKSEFCPHCGGRMFPGSEIRSDAIIDAAPISPPALEARAPEPENITEAPPAMKKCPSCGAENSPESRFCLGCGRVI